MENSNYNLEKIYFDESTFIWKGKLKLSNYRDLILKESLDLISSSDDSDKKIDAYKYFNSKRLDSTGNILVENKLDEICQSGINVCKRLYENQFNKVNADAWINVVRSKDPVQPKLTGSRYHTHTDIQSRLGSFFPNYTYVYYIQMPDVMDKEEGVLYFKGKDDKEYWVRPEEDDLIIMEGWMPHSPNNAPNSTLDRIVMAGNVGFEYIKQQKSLV
jgi:hypothetical protein